MRENRHEKAEHEERERGERKGRIRAGNVDVVYVLAGGSSRNGRNIRPAQRKQRPGRCAALSTSALAFDGRTVPTNVDDASPSAVFTRGQMCFLRPVRNVWTGPGARSHNVFNDSMSSAAREDEGPRCEDARAREERPVDLPRASPPR